MPWFFRRGILSRLPCVTALILGGPRLPLGALRETPRPEEEEFGAKCARGSAKERQAEHPLLMSLSRDHHPVALLQSPKHAYFRELKNASRSRSSWSVNRSARPSGMIEVFSAFRSSTSGERSMKGFPAGSMYVYSSRLVWTSIPVSTRPSVVASCQAW